VIAEKRMIEGYEAKQESHDAWAKAKERLEALQRIERSIHDYFDPPPPIPL